jgi:hypothetical protein
MSSDARLVIVKEAEYAFIDRTKSISTIQPIGKLKTKSNQELDVLDHAPNGPR